MCCVQYRKKERAYFNSGFLFKNNKKLRAILIYNVAGNNNKIMEEKKEINAKAIKAIKEAKNKEMEVICFGDFNMQYSQYKKKKEKGIFIKKDLMFFQKLDQFLGRLISKEIQLLNYKNKRTVFNYQKTEDLYKEFFEKELIENALEWRDEWSIEEKWLFYKKKLDEKKNKYIKKEKITNTKKPNK
ncbi:hypothetical protein C1646_670030 [Rhizophagus diaphanus]|nr:hypothetical protein C1646_670030 [Rhizophagus diaphanus] [Rhizophagus sp. MUCL 43196]